MKTYLGLSVNAPGGNVLNPMTGQAEEAVNLGAGRSQPKTLVWKHRCTYLRRAQELMAADRAGI